MPNNNLTPTQDFFTQRNRRVNSCQSIGMLGWVKSTHDPTQPVFKRLDLVCIWIPLILLKTENNKKNNKKLLFMLESTVRMPDCTDHVP